MATRGRNGRFKKGGHKVHHRRKARRSTSVAMVRVPSAPMTRTRTRTITRVVRGRSRGGGGGGPVPFKALAEGFGWGAVLGYVEQNYASTFQQIPTFGKVPREFVAGVAARIVFKHSKHANRFASAALAIAGNKFGAAGFKLSGYED